MSHTDFESYAIQYTSVESPLIRALVEASDRELDHIDMISGPIAGQLLQWFMRAVSAKKVLEVGTFTGYGTLTMAECLPDDGKIITIDVNKQFLAIARQFFNKSNKKENIEIIEGYALDVLPGMEAKFDLIFLDADKINYPAYYDLLVPMLIEGGVLIIDNAYWGGKVHDSDDEKGHAIHQTNEKAMQDERVKNLYLPVRDGLHVVEKKNRLIDGRPGLIT